MYGATILWAIDSGMAFIGFLKFLPLLLFLVTVWQNKDLPYFSAVMVLIFDTNHFSLYVIVENAPAYVSGDLNEDGKVNNKDLGLLMQHLNGWNVDIRTDAADVNRDGKVNNKDYGLFMQYLNGWGIELL